jgi:hypothetical protein
MDDVPDMEGLSLSDDDVDENIFGDDDVDENNIFGDSGSRNGCKKKLKIFRAEKGLDLHKCLECRSFYDTYPELRKHLKNTKCAKDFKKKLNDRVKALEERIEKLEDAPKTPAIEKTECIINQDRAWLVKF